MEFHENLLGDSRFVTCGQSGMAKRGAFCLQLLVANAPKKIATLTPHYTKIHQSWSVMLVSVYESWYKHILLIKAER